MSFVTILCALAIVVVARWNALWILPLQLVATTARTYRTRRTLFVETWSFAQYLSWRVRLHVGLFGLWWLVALAPAAVAHASAQAHWWLAVPAVAVALAWHHWSGRVVLILIGASPLERPDLDGHFQRVFAAARVPKPPLWRAGVAGGVLANAFAMATLAERGVLFFDSLLDRLSPDETTAILAHEVAHLEQFTRRRVLGIYLFTSLLIVLLMIGSAIASEFIPGFESWVWLVSFVGVFAGILLRARRMQGHETNADLRAVELCGNPEALVRGLTRIYEINHIPRRWSARYEKYATHPSLERRIHAIRGETAAADASIERSEKRRRDLGIAQRVAVLIVVIFAAPYTAIGAVIGPALLAMRHPKRSIMLALAAALAGTAIASINELNVSVVRIALLSILALTVLWSIRRQQQQPHDAGQAVLWSWVEWAGLLIPVAFGLIIAVASARDLFGLHSAVRDRAWFTAALATVGVFCFVQTGRQSTRRLGLGVGVLATAAFAIGSPWFLLHAVADPLVTVMPYFTERSMPAITLAQRDVAGEFSWVRLTPDGNHFLLNGEDAIIDAEDDGTPLPRPQRFVIGGFDGWSREIRAHDVAEIDQQRLLVLERDGASSRLRAEDLRTGQVSWTMSLPDMAVETVHASQDGRWRALARRGNTFDRIEGQVGHSQVTSTRWTVTSDERSYLDLPRIDSGGIALGIAPLWEEPSLSWLLSDFRQTTRLLRVDPAGTTELATSHLSVDCPVPPMGVAGFVCISHDGRSSRFWKVDVSNGKLIPIGETARIIWNASQLSDDTLAGVSSGRPMLVSLDSQTMITLTRDQSCWTQDVSVAKDVMVAICSVGGATSVTQFRLP